MSVRARRNSLKQMNPAMLWDQNMWSYLLVIAVFHRSAKSWRRDIFLLNVETNLKSHMKKGYLKLLYIIFFLGILQNYGRRGYCQDLHNAFSYYSREDSSLLVSRTYIMRVICTVHWKYIYKKKVSKVFVTKYESYLSSCYDGDSVWMEKTINCIISFF